MCGIAGYHLAPEVARELLDKTSSYNLAVVGLKANAHRGKDAAGFFAVEDQRTVVYKQEGDSGQFINDVMPSIEFGVPNIVAIHTRAATKGEAKNNINNHPVVWGDVVVTHNGFIANDDEIKKAVTFRQLPEPEVDSAAIAAVLNHAAIDPLKEFDTIVQALGHLRGNFAFHAVWTEAPGYSLLVRGTSNPLHVSYDDDLGIFLYSSEMSGVKDLQKELSIKLDVRGFDPRTVLLLHNGVPVKWGTLPDYGESDVLVSRLNPGGESWVESTRRLYYAADGRPWSIKDDKKAHVFLEKGILHKDALQIDLKDFAHQPAGVRILPNTVPMSAPLAALAEADRVMRFSFASGQTDTVSAWFGNVEVLMDQDGRLIDVFNWDLDYDRFDFIELPPPAPEVLTFDEWWAKHTSLASGTWQGGRLPLASGQTNNLNSYTGTSTKIKAARVDGLPNGLFHNSGFLGLNMINGMIRCKRDVSIPVLLNERCPTHNQWLINHHQPAECEFVQMATLAALDKVHTITLAMAMTRGNIEVHTWSPTNEPNPCVAHSWYGERKMEVSIGDGKLIKVHLPFRDRCKDCDFVRQISKWTPAVEKYLNRGGK